MADSLALAGPAGNYFERRGAVKLIAGLVALLAFAPAAQAADIEGKWDLGNREVTVTANSDGSFTGTVTARGSACAPVGTVMWTEVRAQADGSYWGKSQWWNQDCGATGTGPNAFRVMKRDTGGWLKACFSRPGGPQPTIAPDGTTANYDSDCQEWPRVAPPSTEPEPETEPDTGGLPRAITLVEAVVKKDGRRGWDVKVDGRIAPPPGKPMGPGDCAGPSVLINIKYKGRKIATARASVDPDDCRFKKTIEIKRSKAPKGRLTVSATWTGNAKWGGDGGQFTAKIPS